MSVKTKERPAASKPSHEELLHICGTGVTSERHGCFQGNPECRSFCGRDLVDETMAAGRAGHVECIVCAEMERAWL